LDLRAGEIVVTLDAIQPPGSTACVTWIKPGTERIDLLHQITKVCPLINELVLL
jgi:hypothetical protein